MSGFPPLAAVGAPDLSRILFHDDTLILGRVLGSDMLLLACAAMAVVTCAAFAAMIMARREAGFANRLARRRAAKLEEALRTVRLVEDVAGIGVWQYDPRTGAQQWSTGLRKIFGVNHSDPFLEGDAETLLFANDVDFVGAVKNRTSECEPYSLQFDIHGFDGCPRSVSMQVCNLASRDGRSVRVVAVVRDITQEISQVRKLEHSRALAMREANKARELAETDALTGLANRRRVMKRLDQLILNARRGEKPLTLIVFDIDHFKSVNDTHGHAAGDKVLQKVAQIALDQARDGDVVGRIGGEEFVWVVPGASQNVAQVMSERLRVSVAAESATESVAAVTVSAGFAELLPNDSSLSLLARADSALYDAKGAGRNQVKMAA